LAEALVEVASEGRNDALDQVAADYGRRIGRRSRRRNSETRLVTALRLVGYDSVVVCRTNHALVAGMVEGVQARSFDAVLDRAPGRCCVLARPSTLRRGQRGGPASTAQRRRDE
jgi:hypothetical protein